MLGKETGLHLAGWGESRETRNQEKDEMVKDRRTRSPGLGTPRPPVMGEHSHRRGDAGSLGPGFVIFSFSKVGWSRRSLDPHLP